MKTRDIRALFNRGRISKYALAREDVSRVSLSAEVQTNWMPRALGSMMLRPGLQYVADETGVTGLVPFIFSNDDTAIINLEGSFLSIFGHDESPLLRANNNTTVTNGAFSGGLTGWTDADAAGALSSHSVLGLRLVGTGYNSAARQQQVTTDAGDVGEVIALRIRVLQSPVLLKIGTTAGDDDVFRQAVLRPGYHSIAFTAPASFWIDLSNSRSTPAYVGSCQVEAGGIMKLPTPWVTAEQIATVRHHQVADVIFVAADGIEPQRIERRPNDSWSIVAYRPEDGPFFIENTDNILMTPSAISGEITLTSSRPYFQSGHVGALFQITSRGQLVSAALSGSAQFSDPIRVTGVGSARQITVDITGTWTGTVSLQRSLGGPGAWVTVTTWTANTAGTGYNDNLDNSDAYYRIGFDTGDHSSGTATCSLTYETGSITGVVRISGFTSSTQVDAVVLDNLGGTDASDIWAEGEWSNANEWPQAVAVWEGRAWWSGHGKNHASVPDALLSFDENVEGDARAINRSVGDGAVSKVNWMLPMTRLIVGADGGEYAVRSTSIDEPVTPTNYNAKAASTRGSAPQPAAFFDDMGYFVDKTQRRVIELAYDPQRFNFGATDTTLLVPEIGQPSLSKIAVQTAPDMRLHVVRSDGTVAILVRDSAENVMCWVDFETDGTVEDVVVLPGQEEDRVYYLVQRSFGRFLERWSMESECRGGVINKNMDMCITGTGAISLISYPFLEGLTLSVWADGVDMGLQTVSGYAIALDSDPSQWAVGLPYTAQYKTSKLSSQTALGSPMTQLKRINSLGLILADTHAQGLRYGPSFDLMDDLPLVEDGADIDTDAVWESYDQDMIEFPGDWETDARICLEASSPRPCTVLAAVFNIDAQDHD